MTAPAPAPARAEAKGGAVSAGNVPLPTELREEVEDRFRELTALGFGLRAGAFAYRDRKAKKRQFRRLWIVHGRVMLRRQEDALVLAERMLERADG